MPKKVKKYESPEFKEAAKKRMEAYWEKRHRQEEALKQIKRIVEAVYLAGWKQNKAQVIEYRIYNQLSVMQATDELIKLFNGAFV